MSKKAIGWMYCISFLLGLITLLVFTGVQPEISYWFAQEYHAVNCSGDIQYHVINNDDCYKSASQYDVEAHQDSSQARTYQNMEVLSGLGMIIAGLLGMIAWINALINLSRGQQWAWFVLMFFFSGIVMLIYLIGGPPVPKKGQVLSKVQLQSAFAYPQVNPQVYQPQQSALDVLQMRLARGEIDEQTYLRLSEALKR